MGRFIKNFELQSRSYSIRLPIGTDTKAPQFPVDGLVRFNDTLPSSRNLEVYYNGSWHSMGGGGGRVAIVKDYNVGNGATTTFPMTNTYDTGHEAEILVFVGNIYQDPGVAYMVSGNNIIFTSPPDNNVPIIMLHNFNSTAVA